MTSVIWQQGSNNPDNLHNLATIREWWTNLSGKEVTFQQRMIPPGGELEIEWESQRFDEIFCITQPEIRGITVYWRKPDGSNERSTTPHKLVLDSRHQYLHIFPQSQLELVIRVGLRSVPEQKIAIANPQWKYSATNGNYILQIKDSTQHIEVKVTLSPDNLKQLLKQLAG